MKHLEERIGWMDIQSLKLNELSDNWLELEEEFQEGEEIFDFFLYRWVYDDLLQDWEWAAGPYNLEMDERWEMGDCWNWEEDEEIFQKGREITLFVDCLIDKDDIDTLKDIEISDDGDDWRFDEMCYWHYNTDFLWNGHDLDCIQADMHDYDTIEFYKDLDDEGYARARAKLRSDNEFKNIVNDFIEVSHQPYENFELGIFCHNRRDDCCRGFWPIAYDEYYKLIKEFTEFCCAQIKDELLAAVYHPDRIMRLLAKGYTHDEIMKCYG